MPATSAPHGALHRPAGVTRERAGTGWRYLAPDGTPVSDRSELERFARLALPPAWTHVWINPDPAADVQATGVDARQRTQYRYSDGFRQRHESAKFDHVLAFAGALPALRGDVDGSLRGDGLDQRRVLAAAVRLLDRGFFRVGSEEYARDNHTYGLTTLQREHVRVAPGGVLQFDYVAKEHLHRVVEVRDEAAAEVVAALLRRPDAAEQLLAYEDGHSPSGWRALHSVHVNAYIHAATGVPASAKAFRTWSATVLAAAALAGADTSTMGLPASRSPELRAYRATAALLGNTPAVARASYVHPGVVAAFAQGRTVAAAVEAAAERAGTRELSRLWVDAELQLAVRALLAPPA